MCFLILELTEQGHTFYGNVFQMSALSCAICACLVELGCYITVFHHLFKNDNGNIKKLLSKECIRHRNRCNAITFIGQFYGFSTEFVFMVVINICIVLGKSNIQIKALAIIVKYMEFGILSMVEVLASESLRNIFIESMFSIPERMFFKIAWF